jgi:hypothetical protein
MQTQSLSTGAMFCFSTLDGNKVYIDPDHVAYIEQLENGAKIGFSGGRAILVKDEIRNVHTVIRAYKQGEQE